MTTAAMTGHRPQSLGWPWNYDGPEWEWLRSELKIRFSNLGISKLISGMALGVDTVSVLVAIDLGIPYIAAIPFDGQHTRWKPEAQDLYHELLMGSERQVVVSPGGYAVWKMQKRNEWMVDNSDLLIAVWNGTAGGTGNCVKYAQKQGRVIERIYPNEIVH